MKAALNLAAQHDERIGNRRAWETGLAAIPDAEQSHSCIVRQILAGVPVRVVAVNHDTSIAMLERTYSRHIGDHADALARSALLDLTETAGEVVPMRVSHS